MSLSAILILLFTVAVNLVRSDGFRFLISETNCSFEAMYNFGDGFSDTGAYFSVFSPRQREPYGMTYFQKPVGRLSDGRLYLDFLAEALGFPYLSPMLNSIGTEFRHGANFAVAGSTVLMPETSGYSRGNTPVYLSVQVNQLKRFRNKVAEHENEYTFGIPFIPVPKVNTFGTALYIFNIGYGDVVLHLLSLGADGVKPFFPAIISNLTRNIEDVYAVGGRTFIVLNLMPLGCFPSYLTELPHRSSDVDAHGCMVPLNNAVHEYNKMLKEALSQARQKLAGATVVYVDINSVVLDMFQQPESHGFEYGTRACCGYGGGAYNYHPLVYCGNTLRMENGENATATACPDPNNYVSWDGVQFSEAANKIIASAILNGSWSDPPFPFSHYCNLQPLV